MPHTPKPWARDESLTTHYEDYESVPVFDASGDHVCDVAISAGTDNGYGPATTREQELGNLALIEIAPDLLFAVRRCLPWLGRSLAEGAHIGVAMPNDLRETISLCQSLVDKIDKTA